MKNNTNGLGAACAKSILSAAAVAAAGGAMPAWAQEHGRVKQLEAVMVTATRIQVGEVGSEQVGSVVSRDDIRRFNRDNIGDALNLLPGVTMSNNSHNEIVRTPRSM